MKKSYSLNLLGEKLSVASEASEGHVKKVFEIVEAEIQKLRHKVPHASFLEISLLSCLNIADEFLRYKESQATVSHRVEKKTLDLIGLIGRYLEGAAVSEIKTKPSDEMNEREERISFS